MALALAVIAMLGLMLAGPAAAHVGLQISNPGDGAVLDEGPDEIRLLFNESVTALPGGIAVTDASGAQVASNPTATTASLLSLELPSLDAGSYVITARVLSADGHVIDEASSFSVRGPQGAALLPPDRPAPAPPSPPPGAPSIEIAVDDLAAVARFLAMAGTMIAAGMVAVSIIVRIPVTPPARRVLAGAAAAGALGHVATVLLQSVRITGEIAWSALALGNGVGPAALLGVVGLAVAINQRREQPALAVAGAGAAVASFSISGHSRVGGGFIEIAADIVHVAGGAIWLGGLALLLGSRARDAVGRDTLRRSVARFSSVATAAIIAVGGAGLALAASELAGPSDLFSSSYGQTLLAKSAIVAVIGIAGAYNHFVLVPRITAHDYRPSDWTAFRRAMGAETLGVLIVLGVTAGLVAQPPPAQDPGTATEAATAAPSFTADR